MTIRFLPLFLTAVALAGPAAGEPLRYPATAKVDQVDDYFGTRVADPYRWLEDDNSAATKAWVAAENKVTFGYLDRIPFRAAVRERIRALADYPKYSAPFQKNGKVFFYKNDGLQNQPALYVQTGQGGKPELLLDPNTFSADGTVRLSSFTLSKDGRYAAYEQTAIPGSDWHDIHVMEMATRRTLPDVLHWVKFSETGWRGDGFYYSRYPEPAAGSELTVRTEHQKVYFHRIGSGQANDVLVDEDPAHPTRFNSVATTEDERLAILTSSEPGKRGNSLWLRDESKGEEAFRPVVAEIGEDRYVAIESVGDELLVMTNRGAPNWKLMRVDPARPAFDEWTTVLAEQGDPLERVTTAGGRLIARYLKDVTARIEVHGMDGALQNRIELPGPGNVSGFAGERGDRDVFYVFTSMNQPPSIFRY